jgi:hypothetical protein
MWICEKRIRTNLPSALYGEKCWLSSSLSLDVNVVEEEAIFLSFFIFFGRMICFVSMLIEEKSLRISMIRYIQER